MTTIWDSRYAARARRLFALDSERSADEDSEDPWTSLCGNESPPFPERHSMPLEVEILRFDFSYRTPERIEEGSVASPRPFRNASHRRRPDRPGGEAADFHQERIEVDS
jgi:hypothetical protein